MRKIYFFAAFALVALSLVGGKSLGKHIFKGPRQHHARRPHPHKHPQAAYVCPPSLLKDPEGCATILPASPPTGDICAN